MKRIIKWLKRTGVGIAIIFMGISFVALEYYKDLIKNRFTFVWIILCIGFLIVFYISVQNSIKKKYGQPEEELGLGSAFSSQDEYMSQSGKEKHMRPPINTRLLYDSPQGLCFGTYHGKYVCRAPDMPGGVLISGGSGSGKSSCAIIPYLLTQSKKKTMHSLVIDIKHELSDIVVCAGDGAVIVDPLDRESYGINPFWLLNDDSPDQEIFETCQIVAISLIPPTSGDSAFWMAEAQMMLLGFLIYAFKYKRRRDLTSMLTDILDRPVSEYVEEVITNASPISAEYMAINGFYKMADETLMSVYANLQQKIFPLVADGNLAYSFGKIWKGYNPEMLLDRDVYLCIPEHKLEQYGQYVLLALNMTFLWALQLPEKSKDPGRLPIGVAMDELIALLSGAGGKLAMLPQMLRVCRSKGILPIVCLQSIDGLKSVYNEAEVNDILSNLPYKLFLDATTPETQKMVSDWCGTYRRKNISWSGSGKDRKQNVDFSDEKIVLPEDLITLAGSDEAILISSVSGYSRIRKAPYYNTPVFKQMLNH